MALLVETPHDPPPHVMYVAEQGWFGPGKNPCQPRIVEGNMVTGVEAWSSGVVGCQPFDGITSRLRERSAACFIRVGSDIQYERTGERFGITGRWKRYGWWGRWEDVCPSEGSWRS